MEILKKIVQKKESCRQLSRADLLRAFEKAISISLPTASVRELISTIAAHKDGFSGELISGNTVVISIAQVPLPPQVIDRAELIAHLISGMGHSVSLWLHGSSGTVKTVLTQFITRQSRYNWLLAQLRDCSASELDFRLCRVLQTSQSGRIGGVVLDDLPTKHAHIVRLRLLMLANEVHRMNGSIIVTSAKPPSPNLKDCFGENGPNVVNVPYLSREEVAELVKLAGGDAQKWAGVVHSFCGFGHPQLVQARISGLRQRNWPDAELLADIPGIGISAKEIEDERDSIRARLLYELSPNTRELLYRLTLLAGYFDRELAIAVGEVGTPIERPGEELDILLGPWVEALAENRFRISPLVSSAGIKTLSQPIQIEVHKRIVDHLIARHPFPADFLGTLLGHAIGSRHVQGLMWLTMAIMHTRDENRRIISEHLFLLPLLDTNQLLFKEDICISAMLRLAQFRVAVWANKTELLPAIAEQLITEARMLDHKAIADGFLCQAISSILVERSLEIRPQKWMLLLEKLDETLLNGKGELIEYTRTLKIVKYGLEKWTVSQFLFMIRAISLRGIDELIELFTELDRLEAKRRKQLLLALQKYPNDIRLMIDSAWLFDTKRDDFNGVVAANKLRKAGETAEMWGNTGIAVECECARAVMLDEYADDSDGSLASLDEAEKKYPNQVRLARQRASVYYRKGDYPASLATIEQIADIISKDNHIERAFALREAGISAAEIGNFTKASHFFSDACEAAGAATDNMRPMAIGLKGDQALAQFQLGRKGKALNLMHQALNGAEQLNPETGKNEKYCILSIGNAIFWMQKQMETVLSSKINAQIVWGYCSNPEPSEKIMEMSSPPFLAYWYYLALLEAMIGISSGIMDELRKRTRTQKILSFELVLNHFIMAKYVSVFDFEKFFSYMPEYVSKTAYMRENAPNASEEKSYDLTDADVSVIKPLDWTSDLHLQCANDAILAIAAVAVCSNVKNIREQLLNPAGQNKNAMVVLRDFIDCFEKETCPKGNAYDIYAFYLGCLMNVNTITPDKMFIVTYRLWEWLLFHTSFKNTVEDVIADYLARRWQNIIEHQRFNLQQPMIAVPGIEAAIKESAGGTIKIAKLLLATEFAVKCKLDANLRSKLKEHCLQNHKGDTS